MIAEGETTHYVGDVLAEVVALYKYTARKAVEMIQIDYEDQTQIAKILRLPKKRLK